MFLGMVGEYGPSDQNTLYNKFGLDQFRKNARRQLEYCYNKGFSPGQGKIVVVSKRDNADRHFLHGLKCFQESNITKCLYSLLFFT